MGQASSWRPGLVALAAVLPIPSATGADEKAPPPRFVDRGQDGRLSYQAGDRGDRIPDFSHCGFGGGGVPIPDAPIRAVVEPAEGDDGARIQAAIDHVARLPADEDGIRGAVLLRAGRYAIDGQIRIASSGVVLRGEGDGPDGTVLEARGTDRRTLIRVAGRDDRRIDPATRRRVVDAYVPVGTQRVVLESSNGFRAGDPVVVEHPSTAAWITSLRMDRFAPGDAGGWLAWKPGTLDVRFDRVVTAVEGDALTLDAPLTTALDAGLGGATVASYDWRGRVERVGVEHLRCESDHDPDNPLDEQHSWIAIALDDARDCWVRRVVAAHFAGSAVRIGEGGSRITVVGCRAERPVSEVGGYRRHSFFAQGQGTLFLRCRSEQGRHDFAVGAAAPGPNAFVSCEATAALGDSGPIESWASGVLYDNVRIDGGGLSLTNREIEGRGTGWAAANSVLWQCVAPVVTCRNPPGAQNWAIGCWGQFLGDGLWQAPNDFVEPDSLYRAQLAERLGSDALAALESSTIPIEPGVDAVVIEEHPLEERSSSPGESLPITIRDGWIVRGDSLLTGGRIGTAWWRGSILPARAEEVGVGVTRFVPGRDGPGATDDLDRLTDAMIAGGTAVLAHHWGLWYDRRRDDHQMVRRIDGEAWPPFYEQPWARSGLGTAWDGLSKYDLTAFNPWYFARLDAFAGQCDRKGLVLLHQAYFQHNVLEAGAHWADFPWRPANCLQETGFPEPPPYEGNKRVFMAEAFYDVTHPVRRELHRRYIRQSLDVLGDHPNVIFSTGEEYTGPLEFVRFWIDTVAEWGRETGKDVILGLSCTKDVQDAILDDPARSHAVSVIELKYWWPTADGGLYAPEGGQDLAPRQHWRAWRGSRRTSAVETARAVRTYRDRFPEKAILCAFDFVPVDPWAVLVAGGSIPDLPKGVDPALRSSLPRLRPYAPPELTDRQFAIADPGRTYLVYSGAGEAIRLDLSDARSTFRVRWIDLESGRALMPAVDIIGGRMIAFPDSGTSPRLLFLTRADED